MKKNSINKNLIIYSIKNKINAKTILIFISLKLGWLLFPLNLSKNININTAMYGYNKLYKFYFKIKGFGYKWKYVFALQKHRQTLFLKLGFTHRIVLIIKNNCKCKIKKRRLILKHRTNAYLRNNLQLLFFLYKTYLYNKKGLYLRGTKFKLKLSKKKSKF